MATAHDPGPVPAALVRKIAALPPGRVAEIEDFVDFLSQRERAGALDERLRRAAPRASAPSLAAIWENPDDDAYDAL